MELHLVGFCIFVLTFIAGTCLVNQRLGEVEDDSKCSARNVSIPDTPPQNPAIRMLSLGFRI